ncbi:Kunitz trypsin inhibitor [Thalictrum thalictroides]|uniref:Kunitz trypsin inhibitor n=1 Tax=Thalictrum thalictroides TaxID=46969 RepID=A0A7J6UUZ4_THATH|nr:Kunitz trypsin inhibitor [Thalictrum thalictroides]
MISVVGLLLLVIANPIATTAQPAVLDITGQALEPGVQYHILPSGSSGGGATLVNPNASCPLYIGLENRAPATGLPVIIVPFVSDELIIRESSDFTLYFAASSACDDQRTDWQLDTESDPTMSGRMLIRTGQENASSYFFYFRILRDGNAYKLHYCPTDVCTDCIFRCGDIGVSVENGKRLLALYVPALSVVFQRA